MDTITHGIAGALLGKGVFGGDDLFTRRPVSRARLATWAVTIGAVFPDSDTLRDFFSHDHLLLLTWHRSITHSLVCLPLFALLLAALTRAVARWRHWPAPSFAALAGLYAAGILSHIFLDLATSFGTMIWSPLGWSRPAWDLLFIVDFTFTAILLAPQALAWVYERPESWKTRAAGCWLAFGIATLLVSFVARSAGADLSNATIVAAVAILAALFFLPAVRDGGSRVRSVGWNRAGLAAGCAYLALAAVAHAEALQRTKAFAAFEKLDVHALAALPQPPSLWRWHGLVLTPRGVYVLPMNLSQRGPRLAGAGTGGAPEEASAVDSPALEYRYLPDAPDNAYIEEAKRLPSVQNFLWFARFPVVRFRKGGDGAVVEFFDERFPQMRAGRPSPFTYRVEFDASGNVVSEGWARE
jgi:membrane-bound metal-dependent hydrolase YbcI (DUF457 family)